jgi:hypothetical protein
MLSTEIIVGEIQRDLTRILRGLTFRITISNAIKRM